MTGGQWLPVPGYEVYEVEPSLRAVRSVDRVVINSRGRACPIRGRVLRPHVAKRGTVSAPQVTLYDCRGGRNTFPVSSVIAMALS